MEIKGSKATNRSYVVTGGGRGVGRAIIERLLDSGFSVVAVDFDPEALTWLDRRPAGTRVAALAGDASDERMAQNAVEMAAELGTFSGWVNNAAVFRDASVHTSSAGEIFDLVALNLKPVIVGASVAIRFFLERNLPGAIVNVSSHQANRAVPGCLPYVTAKAGIEGMTRALAVEYGGRGVRVNAVALGSIRTERYRAYLDRQTTDAVRHIEQEMAALHPLGRIGEASEVADAVAFLLSEEASFITGITMPVDGGRSVLGRDPEEYEVP